MSVCVSVMPKPLDPAVASLTKSKRLSAGSGSPKQNTSSTRCATGNETEHSYSTRSDSISLFQKRFSSVTCSVNTILVMYYMTTSTCCFQNPPKDRQRSERLEQRVTILGVNKQRRQPSRDIVGHHRTGTENGKTSSKPYKLYFDGQKKPCSTVIVMTV